MRSPAGVTAWLSECRCLQLMEENESRVRGADLKEKSHLVPVLSHTLGSEVSVLVYPSSLYKYRLYPWCSVTPFCCRVPRRISVEERTRQRAILKPKIRVIREGRCSEVLQQKRCEYLGLLCAGGIADVTASWSM